MPGDGEGNGAPAEGGAGPEAILPDVAALSAERDEYLQALQRLKADFDNYRKRVARLEEEQAVRAAGDVVRKLLPVLDHLDLALVHLYAGRAPQDVPGAGGDVAEQGAAEQGAAEQGAAEQGAARAEDEAVRALAQAHRELLDVLSREGLERVDDAGVPFDPTVHDAVAHAPSVSEEPASGALGAGEQVHGADGSSEVASTTSVDEVMRAGYRWRGQVLRPAMVRVRD